MQSFSIRPEHGFDGGGGGGMEFGGLVVTELGGIVDVAEASMAATSVTHSRRADIVEGIFPARGDYYLRFVICDLCVLMWATTRE